MTRFGNLELGWGKRQLGLLLIFLLADFGLAYRLYQQVEAQAWARAEDQLETIATAKADEISLWVSELGRLRQPPVSSFVAQQLAVWSGQNASHAESRRTLQFALAQRLQESEDFREILLVGLDGRLAAQASVSNLPTAVLLDAVAEPLAQTLADGEARFVDLRRMPGEGKSQFRLGYIWPLAVHVAPKEMASDAGSVRKLIEEKTQVGALILLISPEERFYPLISRWPGKSETGEVLLVRRETDEVVFLNRLRNNPNDPLSVRLPITQVHTPSVALMAGNQQVRFTKNGVSYSGDQVYGVGKTIPGTSWGIVAIENRGSIDALLAPLRIGIIFSALLLALGVTGLLVGLSYQSRLRETLFVERTQRAQRQLQEKLEILSRYAREPIVLLTPDGIVSDVNHAAARCYGYSVDELRGMHVRNLRYAEGEGALAGQLADALQAVDGTEFMVRARRKDGSGFPAHVSMIRASYGEEIFLVSVIHDMTEIQAVNERLRASEAYLRQILDTASEAILMVSAEGPLRFANRAAREFLHLPLEGPAERTLAQIFSPADVTPLLALQPGEQLRCELRVQRVHHALQDCWCIVSAVRIDTDNVIEQGVVSAGKLQPSPSCWLLMLTDISERRRSEQHLMNSLAREREINAELEQAHKMLLQAEKMASVGQLAAGVAHEINNPIGFVSSNLSTLGEYVEHLFALVEAYEALLTSPQQQGQVAELRERQEYNYLRTDAPLLLQESREGLQRVMQIVRDLKTFSHPGEVAWQWADLHAGIDSSLNIVHSELKNRVTVERHYGELPQVYCNISRLNQVFLNLIVNAGQAIDGQGVLCIHTGCCDDGLHVWLEFTDTGHGIDAEHLERIFDPFFTTKPVGSGTGLGLSVSYGIINKHGGQITVSSRLNHGTTFRIILPIMQAETGVQTEESTT